MVSLGPVPLSLILIILLFIPGVIGLDLYYRYSQRSTSLTRPQLLVYSAAVGVLSLLLLYLSSPLTFGVLTRIGSFVGEFGTVKETDLVDLSISQLVVFYTLHVVVSGGLGIFVGSRNRAENADRREPWEYGFGKVPKDGETIEVLTANGVVVSGEYNEAAWDDSRRELFLDDPYEIEYDGDSTVTKKDMGRSVILQEASISQVIFVEKDPDRKIASTDEEVDSGEKSEDTELPDSIRELLDMDEQATFADFEQRLHEEDWEWGVKEEDKSS